MIIVLKSHSTQEQAEELLALIKSKGLEPLYLPGEERTVLGALGDERQLAELHFENHPYVEEVKAILSPYKKVSRELHPEDTVVTVANTRFCAEDFVVIAGPCAVENEAQMQTVAKGIHAAGANLLRGGIFKPRTSPYSFQGLGLAGLELFAKAAADNQMGTVTEVTDIEEVAQLDGKVSMFQIGARNMQNFRLLKAVGQTRTPVLLKRGMAAKIDELLLAAEYIVDNGNEQVVLCERGIRTYETATRNTLDLNAVALMKQRCHLPVVVDPSHGTGVRELVVPMAKAAVAAGADGIIVEVHPDPTVAMSDAHQQLSVAQFQELMHQIAPFVKAAGRSFA
ncbi:MAG: 3-deoxy-7-phosphoheptulonate synthase [Gammaproteobacteria bacterium]|nr:3-deoxy-7-phosphoheptulonate synthase [Gammaproteobacteria bacterium]NNJ73088.1 3-deoxy-7-phosphoheptulonate synthase [Enterobacterales bacterium]